MTTESRSLKALKEFTKPANLRDWSHLILGLVFAITMLLTGRIWGESLYAATNDRALQNEANLQGLTQRFEDHVTVEADRHDEILTQLREIRRLVVGQGAG
jgi:hypothetical protein